MTELILHMNNYSITGVITVYQRNLNPNLLHLRIRGQQTVNLNDKMRTRSQ